LPAMQCAHPGSDFGSGFHEAFRCQNPDRLPIRRTRYLQALTGFDLIIEHRPGLEVPRDDLATQILRDCAVEAQALVGKRSGHDWRFWCRRQLNTRTTLPESAAPREICQTRAGAVAYRHPIARPE